MPPSLEQVKLPLARYRVSITLDAPLELPNFVGTMIRSALGESLRGTVCLTGAPTCSGCRFLQDCPWPAFMSPRPPEDLSFDQRFSEVPGPYVIEADPCGIHQGSSPRITRELGFSMVLIGSWLERLPLLIVALQRAAARGFGSARVSGLLNTVELMAPGAPDQRALDTLVWSRSQQTLSSHDGHVVIPVLGSTERATLDFFTPLKLQKQGSTVKGDEVTPRRLVAALTRRVNLLFATHAGLPAVVPEYAELCCSAEHLTCFTSLERQSTHRYSARQRRTIPLEGLVGTVRLEGDLGRLLPLLWLGQLLHIGKTAAMGFGGYRLNLE